jgi:hypothetical protein
MQPTQKSRPVPTPREEGATRKRPGRLAPLLRVAISLWIVWHFTAIFFAALSLQPTSMLVLNVAQRPPMQWYLDALYLNQQHSFFAPEVGPGNVIHYELLDQSGGVIVKGELPSRKEHWPRLRYHRHFMLADQASMPTPDQEVNNYWQRRFLEAYARQLLRANENAQAVRVRRLAHWPLPLFAVERYGFEGGYRELVKEFARQGRRADEQGYELLLEVTQRRSDIRPAATDQSGMWQNGGFDTAGRWTGAPR